MKYQAGDVAALEVNLSQVELARARRDVIAASTEYKNGLLSLGTLIGMATDADVTIEGELAAGLPPLPEKEALLARRAGPAGCKSDRGRDKEIGGRPRDLSEGKLIPNVTWGLFQGRTERRDERGATFGIYDTPL